MIYDEMEACHPGSYEQILNDNGHYRKQTVLENDGEELMPTKRWRWSLKVTKVWVLLLVYLWSEAAEKSEDVSVELYGALHVIVSVPVLEFTW